MRNKYRDKLYEAKKLAEQVISATDYCYGMVSTNSIIKAVKKITKSDIVFAMTEFISIDSIPKSIYRYSSMLSRNTKGKKYSYRIVLDEKMSAMSQRLSLVHELGHIITNNITTFADGGYVLSGRADNDYMYLIEDGVSDFVHSEIEATAFALFVLMPEPKFSEQINTYTLQETADYFGVSTAAVIHRLRLRSDIGY